MMQGRGIEESDSALNAGVGRVFGVGVYAEMIDGVRARREREIASCISIQRMWIADFFCQQQ